jgi:acyl-CoA thioesterase-2
VVPVVGLLEVLALQEISPGCFRADSVQVEHPIVFGGQLIGQSLVAGAHGHDGKAVKTIHTVFARGARPDRPLELTVTPVQQGRTFASSAVTVSQEGRTICQSTVLLSAPDPDLMRHSQPAGDLPEAPGAAVGERLVVVPVGGVDVSDPTLVGPAELDVWACFPGARASPINQQALLCFATELHLIGTAMRPHAGVGQSQAHVTVDTSVISHTLTFHEALSFDDWLLLRHTSPYAGHGRAYGRGDVFTRDGHLVASFVQDSMIRAMAGATP